MSTQPRNKDINHPGPGGQFAARTHSNPGAQLVAPSPEEAEFTRAEQELYRHHREERHALIASSVPALRGTAARFFPGASKLGLGVEYEGERVSVNVAAVELQNGDTITDPDELEQLSGTVHVMLLDLVRYEDDLEIIATTPMRDATNSPVYGVNLA